MHPVIIQAVATERSAEMRAHAAAARQALQTRRSRPAGPRRRLAWFVRIPTFRPAPRPRHDPETA
jgi:hypothetical protein